jgi:hypothetical protein
MNEKNEKNEKLKNLVEENELSYECLNRLLEAEKVKKLLKRNAFMQTKIANEIERQLDEN